MAITGDKVQEHRRAIDRAWQRQCRSASVSSTDSSRFTIQKIVRVRDDANKLWAHIEPFSVMLE
jgi:hypothetical protein